MPVVLPINKCGQHCLQHNWPNLQQVIGNNFGNQAIKDFILFYHGFQPDEGQRLFICTICGDIAPEEVKSFVWRLVVNRVQHLTFEWDSRQFFDHQFLPSPKSLFFKDKLLSSISKENRWHRPSADCVLFSNPKPTDVIQGHLGDCWFMASLSAIAEYPELLHNIIQKVNQFNGCYQVCLCLEGVWTTVCIDNLIPCGDGGKPVYARLSRGQLFAALIEKAAAKMFNCYQALDGGFAIESFSLLTGAPCETFEPAEFDEDGLWKKLNEMRRKCHMITVATNDLTDPKGLRGSHVYSLTGLQCVDGLRLIKLRDPVGKTKWSGDYSEQSPLLTSELKKRLDYQGHGGQFWITIVDFRQLFHLMTVCKVRSGLYEERRTGLYRHTYSSLKTLDVYAFEVQKPTEIDFSLWLSGVRGNKNKVKQYDVSLAVVTMKKTKIHNTVEILKDPKQTRGYFLAKISLNPGNYSVIPILHNLDQDNGYAISVHSTHRISLEKSVERKYKKTLERLGICETDHGTTVVNEE